MSNNSSPFTLENEVFKAFVFYATLLLMKFFMMAFLTLYKRRVFQVHANPEDCNVKLFGDVGDGKTKPILNHPSVERVRRNHANDIENILPFVLIGLLYVTTGPSYSVAVWHFRIFAIARYLHMICYQVPIPQPSRALCFAVGVTVTVSMAIQNIMATM